MVTCPGERAVTICGSSLERLTMVESLVTHVNPETTPPAPLRASIVCLAHEHAHHAQRDGNRCRRTTNGIRQHIAAGPTLQDLELSAMSARGNGSDDLSVTAA